MSIGSDKAHLKYHLSKKIKIKKFNILTCDSNEIKKLVKFCCIIIPNIEYLFTNKQLKKKFSNLKKLLNKETDIFFCFKSRYTLITNIIDHIIRPLETFLTKYIKFIKYKSFRIKKIHHGFRRKDIEIEKIKKNLL